MYVHCVCTSGYILMNRDRVLLIFIFHRGGDEFCRFKLPYSSISPTLSITTCEEQDQLPCGPTLKLNASGSCQERETCLVWECHAIRQPFRKDLSGHLGEWVTPWSAEEMLDGQRQRVDTRPMPELLTMASCRKDWNRICAESSFMTSPLSPSDDPVGGVTDLT